MLEEYAKQRLDIDFGEKHWEQINAKVEAEGFSFAVSLWILLWKNPITIKIPQAPPFQTPCSPKPTTSHQIKQKRNNHSTQSRGFLINPETSTISPASSQYQHAYYRG